MGSVGVLYFFCGKMGAGKSTRARQLAATRGAVLLSEDEWLATLFPGSIASFDDYIEHAARLKPLLNRHVVSILAAGADVVMDFPANTTKQRRWLMGLAEQAETTHEMYYLDASNEECLRRIAQRRREQPQRAAFDTEPMFLHVTKHFEPPDKNEGIHIIVETSV